MNCLTYTQFILTCLVTFAGIIVAAIFFMNKEIEIKRESKPTKVLVKAYDLYDRVMNFLGRLSCERPITAWFLVFFSLLVALIMWIGLLSFIICPFMC